MRTPHAGVVKIKPESSRGEGAPNGIFAAAAGLRPISGARDDYRMSYVAEIPNFASRTELLIGLISEPTQRRTTRPARQQGRGGPFHHFN